MQRSQSIRHLDRVGRVIRLGDLVRVARSLGCVTPSREYRRSFRLCAGRVLQVLGWDQAGLLWIPLRHGEVLSVEPHILLVVGRARHHAILKNGIEL